MKFPANFQNFCRAVANFGRHFLKMTKCAENGKTYEEFIKKSISHPIWVVNFIILGDDASAVGDLVDLRQPLLRIDDHGLLRLLLGHGRDDLIAFFLQILNFTNFWRARSRLYQNEILQENMRLTAFFKLYKICILLHRSKLNILAKNRL